MSQDDIEAFARELSSVRSPATVKTYCVGVARFLNFIYANGWTVETLPPNVLSLWIEATMRDLEPWTVRKYVSGANQFLDWHKRCGTVLLDYVQPLLPRIRQSAATVIRGEMWADYAEACNHQPEPYRTCCLLISASGLRGSEACALKAHDIEIVRVEGRREAFAHVHGTRQDKTRKSRVDRRVPLLLPAQKLLFDYLRHVRLHLHPSSLYIFPSPRGKLLTLRTLELKMAEIGEEMGIALCPHDVRHSAITYFIKCKISPRIIQLIAGHEKFETTEKYLHDHADDGGVYDEVTSKAPAPWLKKSGSGS